MPRLVLSPNLDAVIADRVGRPAVERWKRGIADGARRRAPDGKAWLTRLDERVRPAHVEAHGQLIPANLRYQLRKMVYVRKGRGPHGRGVNPLGGWELLPPEAGYDLGRKPGDPALPIEQVAECRCQSADVPGAVARTIEAAVTRVEGTRAAAEVSTRFPRAAESEFGTEGDRPARFMAGAVEEVAAQVRAASARHA